MDVLKETVNGCFEKQSKKHPEKTAIVFNEKKISYALLGSLSDTLANRLKHLGVTPGKPVAFFLQRSPEAIVTMLAILKAGGVYVPIDISYPEGRVSFILRDCQPAAILTSHSASKHLPATTIPLIYTEEVMDSSYTPAENTFQDGSPDDPAYIIYTSGTTGTPKGVIIPHRGIVRLVFGQDYIDFGPKKTFLQLASLAFDAATLEIWAPLLHGGTCVLYPNDQVPDPDILQQLISKQKISTLWLTTSLFNTIITTCSKCLKEVPEILVGGEALSPSHIRKALSELPNTKIINGYGPTENTTFTTCYPIPRNLSADLTSIPIGKPLNHTTTYILDNNFAPVAPGDQGELYTGGAGLALGYLNHPEMTAEKFIANPDPNASDRRLYRTGDLVRQLPDGNIIYIDRIDEQVKIRGFRIELGEITTVLLNHPNVKEAVVIVHTSDRQRKLLAAYLIFNGPQTSDRELRVFMTGFLPDYMIPSCFIEIDSIPLNANGKLDKKQLPSPFSQIRDDIIAPSSKMEKQLFEIWNSLLNIDQISIEDNFFDIGGTSLLGMELFAIINKTLNLDQKIEAVALYQFPTIKALAGHISQKNTLIETDGIEKTRANRQRSAFSKFKNNRLS